MKSHRLSFVSLSIAVGSQVGLGTLIVLSFYPSRFGIQVLGASFVTLSAYTCVLPFRRKYLFVPRSFDIIPRSICLIRIRWAEPASWALACTVKVPG